MFKGEELVTAMAVPLFYGLLEAVILGLYCIGAWKAGWTKAPANVGFFTMVGTSYEVLTTEHRDLVSIEVSLAKDQKELKERKKTSKEGDTIHIKHSIDESDDEEKKDDVEKNLEKNVAGHNNWTSVRGWTCFSTPSARKEASGYGLPEVPGESEDAGNVFHLWNR